MKKINSIFVSVLLALLLVGCGLVNDRTQYLQCEKGEFGNYINKEDGLPTKTYWYEPLTIKVKRDLFGFNYTINQYTKDECTLDEDLIFCGKNESYYSLNKFTGKLDSNVEFFFKEKKIESMRIGWSCKSLEKLIN